MPEITPCPECGSTAVYVNAVARGTAIMWFDEMGINDETDADRMWFSPSHVVRCECTKIRRDLYLDFDHGVRRKEG
jgi:hypothetical protein